MTTGSDVKALNQIERRLKQTEADLKAMPAETQEWIRDYLRRNYGWFVREEVKTP